jgi:hypothetical protein
MQRVDFVGSHAQNQFETTRPNQRQLNSKQINDLHEGQGKYSSELNVTDEMSPSSPPLTLTSLLNSLHTHLQSQTQLLPTLHAQLGLPQNALEDELKTLQQHLMHSVESQIDTRKKEVEMWMDKCDAVEIECVKYTMALGGNVKATGSSVGELRNEQVLPKRYAMVSKYQEKLRQVSGITLLGESYSRFYTVISHQARTINDTYKSPQSTVTHAGPRILCTGYH